MEMRRELEYNKAGDVIDGFEDLGNGNRRGNIARKALIFMLKACCSNWKHIMSFYAFSSGAE